MSAYQVPDFHHLTPASELQNRLAGLQTRLLDSGLDAALLVYPVDMFYFTGTLQAGHLLVPSRGEPCLLIRRDLERARMESALENIIGLSSFNELPKPASGTTWGGTPSPWAWNWTFSLSISSNDTRACGPEHGSPTSAPWSWKFAQSNQSMKSSA